MTEQGTWERLATGGTERRGTEKAGRGGAGNDGAEWEQGFVDVQRPDAVRILDWGHATEHLSAGAAAVLGAGTAESSEWLGTQLHELKHGDSAGVLKALRELRDRLLVHSEAEGGEEAFEVVAGRDQDFKVVSEQLAYLEKRRDQIRYAEFIAAGLPIGSGIVESANKLVVEARLKGAGMHWERGHVDPMVALRNVVCSDRWDEAWARMAERLRLQPRERAEERRAQRQRDEAALVQPTVPETAEIGPREDPMPVRVAAEREPVPTGVEDKPASSPRQPAPNHPWRRMSIGRAQRAA